jgi:chromosome segregation ATPase
MELNLHTAIEEQSRILRDISDRLVAQDARWRTLEATVTQNSASIQALEATVANASSSVPRSDLEIQMAATSTRLDAVEATTTTRIGALKSAMTAFESWRPFIEAAVDDIKYSVEKLRGDFAKSSAPPTRLPLPSLHLEMAMGTRNPNTRRVLSDMKAGTG